ncbi:MAG TPA: YciI family protein [Acidimicrobiales bacterium]
MKYMLLIYGNESVWNSVPKEEFEEIVRQTDAQNRALFESGELVGAYGVADQDMAKMVRVNGDGAPAVTDGPYAEAKEYLASFTIVDCDSLERALEIAAANPASRYTGVEVRPLMHEAKLDV